MSKAAKRASKPKGGRPPLAAEDRRDVLIRVLVTGSEQQELQRAAGAAAASVSTFVRMAALERARGK